MISDVPDSRLSADAPLASPPAFMGEDDAKRLSRLLERTLGQGFKLVIVEIDSAAQRRQFDDWFESRLFALGGATVPVGLPSRYERPEVLGGGGFDLWGYVNEHVGKAAVGAKSVLEVAGFEELMYAGENTGRPEILQQINVQRDLFVRDYPCWWILFIHPASRQAWFRTAPDFVDFVALWIENEASELPHPLTPPRERGDETQQEGSFNDGLFPSALARAMRLVSESHYAEALDALQAFRIGVDHSESGILDGVMTDMVEALTRYRLGEYARSLELYRSAEAHLAEGEGETLRSHILDGIADVLEARGEYEEALRIRIDEVLPLFEAQEDHGEIAMTKESIGNLLARLGRHDEAVRIWRDECLPMYEALGRKRDVADVKMWLADDLLRRGKSDEALAVWRGECLPDYEEMDIPERIASVQGRIADALKERGEYEEALRLRREVQLPLLETLGDERAVAAVYEEVADVYALKEESQEALDALRHGCLPVYERLGPPRSIADVQREIARFLVVQKEYGEAVRLLREVCLPIYESLGDERYAALTYRWIALGLQHRGEYREALRIYEEKVLPAFSRLGLAGVEADALFMVGLLHKQLGDHAEALWVWRERCLPKAESLGLLEESINCRMWIGSVLALHGDRERDGEEIALNLGWAYREAKRNGLDEAEAIEAFVRKAGLPESILASP